MDNSMMYESNSSEMMPMISQTNISGMFNNDKNGKNKNSNSKYENNVIESGRSTAPVARVRVLRVRVGQTTSSASKHRNGTIRQS